MINFDKILNFINPQFAVGGLEFSDSSVRFVLVKGRKILSQDVSLPPGVIEEGKIKDRGQLIAVLSDLHKMINRKKTYVIASISDSNVYTESFFLPKATSGNLSEAAKLNLQMISPIEFSGVYSDWQLIGENYNNNASQLELFGAFTARQIIDEYESVLDQTGFSEAAVEFSALALTRALMGPEIGLSEDTIYLMMKVGSEGLTFGLIKKGNLQFMRFISWVSAFKEERSVDFEAMKKLIVEEMRKVISFYETHSRGIINELVLLSSSMTERLSKVISENFPLISVKIPTAKNFPELSSVWLTAYGSALRGEIPRSQDELISLASAGTEEKFGSHLVISFITNWRNIILSFLGVIILIFLIADIFIAKNLGDLENKKKEVSAKPEIAKLISLQTEAKSFNQKVALLYNTYNDRVMWSLFLKRISGVPLNGINIRRIYAQSPDVPVLLVAEAPDENSIIAFKKALEGAQFKNVNLQLTNITQSIKGRVNFSMTFGF